MAAAILGAIETGTLVPHTLIHDLESFGWVLGYSHSRNNLSKRNRALRTQFYYNFGRSKIAHIYQARIALDNGPLDCTSYLGLLSAPLATLFIILGLTILSTIISALLPDGFITPTED